MKKIFITIGKIIAIMVTIFGLLQGFEWLLTKTIDKKDGNNVVEVSKLSPGVSKVFAENILGPEQKSFITDKKNEVFLWETEGNIIGIIYKNNKIDTIIFYNISCAAPYDNPLYINLIGYNLCKDRLYDYENISDFDGYVGAQVGLYLEKIDEGRSSKYMSIFFGSDRAVDLEKYINENHEYFERYENKASNDEKMNKVISLRKNVVPNILVLSNGISMEEIEEIHFMGLYHFDYLSH